ncbi:hypothetical protein QFZ24_009848 [Streptomyces phaeochromogenes]|jgi:hypothetical protein|uniref:DUF2399 domain-containing protein n=1 Tax=Streptomyces phaeochromogenes TaxID=1923 RepID=UPI002790BA08|nr:DUF2399 domain-containing protein [Streptomyces phaeochromogenes]MDQ0955839.1 hypothetical protein [Streptomyces phaeochromogenes]
MTYLKSQDKSPGTMDRALASIAVAHGAADLPKPSTVGARRVLKGHEAERKKSKDPRRRPRRGAARGGAWDPELACAMRESGSAVMEERLLPALLSDLART